MQASDLQLQSARQQIAAFVEKDEAWQAEQKKLAAAIAEQKEVITQQAGIIEGERQSVSRLDMCMQSALEEMIAMKDTCNGVSQSIR